ncbi:MAG: tRNA (guanosine(37)-N1)-methyltransferase TrmD [Rhodocyclaceae bacterium]|nr:tRNA (guanosine(37)-N1)-methyltransferase TrmD [Rhodocyclaceae bacterium]
MWPAAGLWLPGKKTGDEGLVTLRFDVVTLFPEMFAAVTAAGITRRAVERGLWRLATWNPRDWADNAYRTVDDRPFGGGPGMVMMPGPLEKAIAAAKADRGGAGSVIYLSPAGRQLTHRRVCELAAMEGAILLCGRYEGVDERLIGRCVDEEISLGDFVLSGGEIAAMALIDACVRQLPGALNDDASAAEESFVGGLLDCPHYTRPEVYEGMAVPDVLLSGHHENIRRWRLKMSLLRTRERRPELFAEWLAQHARGLSKEAAQLLREIEDESNQ